ncbi:MAG TPA: ATPase domain-containing protein, partial [Blastocatellia bacterium]|nr:ATPase domain-containing protein [Blastocatellia bacterium]
MVRSTADTMAAQVQRTPSGIEPVDALMGGLESGGLYLVHGEASAKSLFGTAFLIEGLKRGEQCAFIVRGAPEDAVRRFARLGFDCLEDVYSGRLVILESSRTMADRVARGGQLAPALRELEWLLGETRPCRLVFDPVTSYVAGGHPLEDRVAEFVSWTKSLGGTSLLIASDSNPEVTRLLKPDVLESFCFDLGEAGNRSTQFLAFEKSHTVAARAIEVDPSRGIFLAERVEAVPDSPRSLSNPASDSRLLDIDVLPQSQSLKRSIGGEIETNGPQVRRNYTVSRINETEPLELDLESIDNALARLVDNGDENGTARPQQPLAAPPGLGKPGAGEPSAEHELDLTSELFSELAGVIFPGDLTGEL